MPFVDFASDFAFGRFVGSMHPELFDAFFMPGQRYAVR